MLVGPVRAAEGELRPPPPLVGDAYRYGQLGMVPRVFVDLVAIPAGMGHWRTKGWLGFGAVALPVAVLMAPTHPSPDARVDAWTTTHLDPHVRDFWAWEIQRVMWGGLAVGGLGTWGVAELADWPEVAQGMSLGFESFAVAQLSHLSMKLLIGREGPTDGDRLGMVLGPGASLRLFPAGTPSGHAATLFSILGSTQAYFAPPWPVTVCIHGLVGGMIVMHVINHGHFPSDSLWGSAMGYAIGVWVVQNRSTRYRIDQGRPLRIAGARVRIGLSPWVPGEGGGGIALGGSW